MNRKIRGYRAIVEPILRPFVSRHRSDTTRLMSFDRRWADTWTDRDSISVDAAAVGNLALEHFYRNDLRRDSREIRFGTSWRDGFPGGWSLWWIVGTGEVIGMRCEWSESAGSAVGTASVSSVKVDPPGVLIVMAEENRVRAMLRGWDDHISDPHGWAWVTSRIDAETQTATDP